MLSARSQVGGFGALVWARSAAALIILLPAAAPALALATSRGAPAARAAAKPHTFLQSRQLWATIDVCNAPDEPDTVGIRGSMPSDGQSRDTMYMRFALQYMDSATRKWADLSDDANSAYVEVGAAKSVRQTGTTFELKPASGSPSFVLRGVVDFQWRQGTAVVASVSRPTTAGRKSLAGADPEGFSAATCTIG